MRVLVSGGLKTRGLANEIAKAFEVGTVEFTQENNIDKLKDFISRGDFFDRAIVMEQSWTYDGSELNETVLRNRLSDFTELALNKFENGEFVFVATSIEKAKIICEETLLLGDRIVAIVKAAPYTRGTFKPMIKESLIELKRIQGFNYEAQIAKEEAEKAKLKADSYDSDLDWDDNPGSIIDTTSDLEVSIEPEKQIEENDTDKQIKISNNLEDELDNDEDDFMNRFCNTSFEDDTNIEGNFSKTSDGLADDNSFNPLPTSDTADWDSTDFGSEPGEFSEFGDSTSEFGDFSDTEFGESANDFGEIDAFGDTSTDFGDFEGDFEESANDFEGDTNNFGEFEDSDNSFGESNTDFGGFASDFGESNTEFGDFGDSEEDFGEFGIESSSFETSAGETEFGTEADFGEFGEESSWGDGSSDFGTFDDNTSKSVGIEENTFGDSIEEFKGFIDDDKSSFNAEFTPNIEKPQIKADLSKKTIHEPVERVFNTKNDIETMESTTLFDENDFGTESEKDPFSEEFNNQVDMFGVATENTSNASNVECQNNEASELFSDEIDSNQLEKANDSVIQSSSKKLFGKNNKANVEETQPIVQNSGNLQRGIFKGIKGKGMKRRKDFTYDMNNNQLSKDAELQNLLNTFRGRGSTIVVTGTSESGKSMLVGNLANMINKMGYTVLIVDCDTVKRSQAYLNLDVYEAIHNIDTEINSLRLTVNSLNAEIGRYAAIARQGLNILSTGLAADAEEVEKVVALNKVTNFIYAARASYNFILFDIDFRKLVGPLSELVLSSDNIVITSKPTTKSIMELMVDMSNIDDVSVREAMFTRGDLIFSHVNNNIDSICGYKVKNLYSILNILDQIVINLIGGPGDYSFSKMRIAGQIQYSEEFDKFWMSKNYASDTQDGEAIYMELLRSIMLKH